MGNPFGDGGFIALFCCGVLLLAGCTFDNEESVFKDVVCPEISDAVTYSDFIKPLLEKRCVDCHNSVLSSGNVNMETHARLKVYIEDGSFFGAIRHLPGFNPMPQGDSKLSNCDIEKIENWIDSGYPEN
ncbi:MAG: hypothetical protein WEB30_11485 [Cyclobacteriaceae bacterium]